MRDPVDRIGMLALGVLLIIVGVFSLVSGRAGPWWAHITGIQARVAGGLALVWGIAALLSFRKRG
jgi:hypothetical protein